MDTRLDGKRAAVTAGAGGAGRVIASRLAGEGAQVFVCDIDKTAVAALPGNLIGATVDVADPEQVDAWLGPIARQGIDILINNAGVSGPVAPVENIGVADWRQCLAVCLDAQFYCARRVTSSMKARNSGTIVNIASTAGLMGLPNRAPYVAAKFGVIGLTKTLAMELGPSNIRVNAIAPGSITGERMDRVIAAHAKAEGISNEQARSSYVQGTSMRTFVDAKEIADIVVYLCSERGRHISGQVIAVDGHTETLYPRPPN